jgi:hypothetical protein
LGAFPTGHDQGRRHKSGTRLVKFLEPKIGKEQEGTYVINQFDLYRA